VDLEEGARLMHRWVLAGVLVGFVTSFGFSQCRYVRTSYKLLSCVAAKAPPEVTVDTHSVDAELPGLEDAPLGPFVTIVCACDYVLRGADPLCDQDRSGEYTSTEGTTNPSTACRPGKSLCAARCPKTLP